MNFLRLIDKPQQHELNIKKHFGGKVRFNGDAPLFDTPLVVVLFTNRSGSNLFAEYLKNTGLIGGLHEATNTPRVLALSEKLKIRRYPDLFRKEAKDAIAASGHYGIKASASQLAMLYRWNIPAMFSGVVVFHTVRDSLLDQSVSMSIAKQTGKWRSDVKTDSGEAKFDFADISGFAERTVLQNLAGYALIEALEVPHNTYRYEEFTRDPAPYIQDALGLLGLEADLDSLPEPSLKKQANQKNEDMKRAYRDIIRGQIGLG